MKVSTTIVCHIDTKNTSKVTKIKIKIVTKLTLHKEKYVSTLGRKQEGSQKSRALHCERGGPRGGGPPPGKLNKVFMP